MILPSLPLSNIVSLRHEWCDYDCWISTTTYIFNRPVLKLYTPVYIGGRDVFVDAFLDGNVDVGVGGHVEVDVNFGGHVEVDINVDPGVHVNFDVGVD